MEKKNVIKVYDLHWPASSISYNRNDDGLWDNSGRIAIHWPFFKKSFGIKMNETLKQSLKQSFYIRYNNDETLESMTLSYSAINDLVFSNTVHRGCSKAQIFTTIDPQI